MILKEMRRKNIQNWVNSIRLKDTLEQLQPPKMGTELSFTVTHIFKEGSGMSELMFILRRSLSQEKQWKSTILQKYLVL